MTPVRTLLAMLLEVEAGRDLLANPEDDHTAMVFAAGGRGNADRILLTLRKPA